MTIDLVAGTVSLPCAVALQVSKFCPAGNPNVDLAYFVVTAVCVAAWMRTPVLICVAMRKACKDGRSECKSHNRQVSPCSCLTEPCSPLGAAPLLPSLMVVTCATAWRGY